MSISNNILAAFVAGVSTKQEDELVMKEFSENEEFSELLDVLDDVDAIDGMNELRNEFCENIDGLEEFKDYNINIKKKLL